MVQYGSSRNSSSRSSSMIELVMWGIVVYVIVMAVWSFGEMVYELVKAWKE